MTQQDPPSSGDTLLDDLKDTPTSDLGAASQRANRFTEEDEDHDKRLGRAQRRKAFRQIQVAFFWFLFVLGCVACTIIVLGFLGLVWIYLRHVVTGYAVADPALLQQIIVGVLWTAVVALATMWAEGALKDADRH